MAKQFSFSNEVRASMARGAKTVNDAVKVTLGAKGRNVLIQKAYGLPQVTKDGVTVARACELKEVFEKMGADLTKEAATKTNDLAGDGTTTAIVLAEAFYREGAKLVASGLNPMEVKADVDRDVAVVVEQLIKQATQITTDEEIKNIATISANGDKQIGDMVAEAVKKIGKDGIISVEDGKTTEIELETVSGLQIRKGFISPYFITSPDKNEAVLEDCLVLVTDAHITNLKDLATADGGALGFALKENKSIVVFCKKMDGEALQLTVVNKLQGKIRALVVELPEYGDWMQEIADDIATVTNGTVIRTETGRTLETVKREELGYAKRITANKDTTTIVDGAGEKSAIDGVIVYLEQRITDSKNDLEKDRLRERIARLKNGVAVIRVGATTESESREKKDRIIDAVSATKAAIAEGIVAGGGKALLEASKGLPIESLTRKVCEEPAKQISENGGKNGSLVAEKMRELPANEGYDVRVGEYCDLVERGIIDPVKVTRLALQHAASVAGLMLTTEAAICDLPEEKK